MLAAGSAVLLCSKFSPPLWVDTLLVFSGGGMLLFGNGQILYGLLVHADNRTYASDDAADMAGQETLPAAVELVDMKETTSTNAPIK